MSQEETKHIYIYPKWTKTASKMEFFSENKLDGSAYPTLQYHPTCTFHTISAKRRILQKKKNSKSFPPLYPRLTAEIK